MTFLSPATWEIAHGNSTQFSAVCLLAGRELAHRYEVTVGLIDASMGGSPIEAWLPVEGLRRVRGMEQILPILDVLLADPAAAEAQFGTQIDTILQLPPVPGQDQLRPRFGFASLFNAMIAPLGDARLRGVIWYQGESNVWGRTQNTDYREMLVALMATWRARFRGDVPFVIVQLAAFGKLSDAAVDNRLSRIREAQRQAVEADPLAALVTTIDVGDRLDIHPPMKKPVGQRAAAALEYLAYEGSAAVLGPRPLAALQVEEVVLVQIANTDGELIAASWGRPGPFMLCDTAADECRFADAQFVSGGVAVALPPGFSADVVRYCWGAAPLCNVFDRAQRPLGPFELLIGDQPDEAHSEEGR